jgi:replication factor A1
MKLKEMLPMSMAGEFISGKLQNLGLIRIVEYTCNKIQNQRFPLIPPFHINYIS